MEKKTLYRYFGNCATEEERIQVLEWTKASPENLKEFCRERNIYNPPKTRASTMPFYYRLTIYSVPNTTSAATTVHNFYVLPPLSYYCCR